MNQTAFWAVFFVLRFYKTSLIEARLKIFLQLVREFFVPLAGAFIWVSVNYDGDLMKSVTLFGGTFFFLSWLTSQFFRVKKQNATEASLLSIRTDIKELLVDLEKRTDSLIGHVTGGPSFCRFEFFFDAIGESKNVVIVHEGTYPLHDIGGRICDVDVLQALASKGATDLERSFTAIPLTALLLPNQVQITHLNLSIGSRTSYRFNVFIEARNGGCIQEIRGVKQGEQWVEAVRVRRYNEEAVCHERVDDLYPRDASGKVDWS